MEIVPSYISQIEQLSAQIAKSEQFLKELFNFSKNFENFSTPSSSLFPSLEALVGPLLSSLPSISSQLSAIKKKLEEIEEKFGDSDVDKQKLIFCEKLEVEIKQEIDWDFDPNEDFECDTFQDLLITPDVQIKAPLQKLSKLKPKKVASAPKKELATPPAPKNSQKVGTSCLKSLFVVLTRLSLKELSKYGVNQQENGAKSYRAGPYSKTRIGVGSNPSKVGNFDQNAMPTSRKRSLKVKSFEPFFEPEDTEPFQVQNRPHSSDSSESDSDPEFDPGLAFNASSSDEEIPENFTYADLDLSSELKFSGPRLGPGADPAPAPGAKKRMGRPPVANPKRKRRARLVDDPLIAAYNNRINDMVAELDAASPPALGPFTCDLCAKIVDQRYKFKVHLKSHIKGRNVQCPHCHRIQKHESSMVTHIRHMHPEKYQEEFGVKKEEREKSLYRGFSEEDVANPSNSDRPFKCPVCGRPFKERYRALQHVDTHAAEKNYLCADCGLSFKTESYLLHHIKEVHPQPHDLGREYHCPEENCGKIYETLKKLKSHLRANHRKLDGDELYDEAKILEKMGIEPKEGLGRLRPPKPKLRTPLACPICNKRFTGRRQLTNHAWRHDPSKRVTCPVSGCGKSFGNKKTLSKHGRVHRDERKILCPECPLTFKWPQGLYKHQLLHHPKEQALNFPCSKCGARFVSQGVLTRHMNEAHFEIPTHKCSRSGSKKPMACKLSFATAEELEAHRAAARHYDEGAEDEVEVEVEREEVINYSVAQNYGLSYMF